MVIRHRRAGDQAKDKQHGLDPLCIGVVAPRTGRLAPPGAPLGHVLRAPAPHLTHVRNGGRRYEVTVAVRDSRSEPGSARRAVRELADEDGARTRLDTVAGTLDWTGGPTPDIALLPLVGGQWQPGPDGPRLAVVHNAGHPEVPLTGDLAPAH